MAEIQVRNWNQYGAVEAERKQQDVQRALRSKGSGCGLKGIAQKKRMDG